MSESENEEDTMLVRAANLLTVISLLILTFSLPGCMGNWFGMPQEGTLIVGKPVISGKRGEVLISVTNMPHEGLASVAIDDKGITYANIKAASIVATGLNGFTVLAQDFTTTVGKGRLVAANPTSGSKGGTILKITFEVAAANPAFGIDQADKDKVALGSALNSLITTWNLSSNVADYYTK